ncbi:MAG: glycosyltransferase family 4 protein [Hyphomicrobium sp.]
MPSAPARPKLLYLVTEDWYFLSHRLALAVAAKAAGYDVSVATHVGRHGDQIAAAGLQLIPLDFSRSGLGPLSEARTLRTLTRLYRRLEPDLVHHVAMKPVIYGSLAARAAGVRGVVNAMMGLGYVFSSDALKARALRPAVRAGLRLALGRPGSRLIVQNEDDRALFAEQGLARRENIRLIRGSGVDPDAFEVTDPPAGVPQIVLPARLLVDKGVGEFVEAARILKSRGVEARMMLVGDPDPLNPAAIPPERIAEWRTEGVVEHFGWQPQNKMPEIFAQASIVCLPSYREGLPKALLEAAAAGRAIVTTDVPGCREIVRPGVNGWRVPARDAGALAAALEAAIRNGALCRSYGLAGRAMVENEFSLASVIRQTLEVYREVFPAAGAGRN